MKKINILIAFILGAAFIFNSCEKMEDVHKDFLQDGDIIYAPKPLIIQSFAGKNRIKLKYYLVNAVNVNKCIIEWEEGNESQTVDITPNLPLDSIELMINNLEEKSYIFKVYTLDDKGNRSVKEQITGSAYDAKYQASISNRALLGIEGGGTIDSLIVSWATASKGLTKVEMTYNNMEGEPITKEVSAEENEVIIRGWESQGSMSYKSFYVPEEGAIDTFMTEMSQVDLPLFIEFEGTPVDKTNWTIVDFSTEEPKEATWGPEIQGLAIAAIDGDNSTFWHSAWDATNPPHPHHFTIDLGDVVKMNAFELVKRSGKDDCQKNFRVEVSLDNENFTSLGSFVYEQANDKQKYQVSSLPLVRYLKYTATEGHTGANHTHLAEFNIEGQVASKVTRDDWEIIDLSSEEPKEATWGPEIQGLVEAALDGDLGTFWHSAWDQSQPAYPHYFTIDMKKTVRMMAVECFRRQGNGNGQTKFKIYTSNDGENFDDQGTFDFDAGIDNGQINSLSFLPEARYFKYEATEGPNHYAFLSEIEVYGKELD